jgi:hypothetical protein
MRRLVVAGLLCLLPGVAVAQTNDAPMENVPMPSGLHGILAYNSIGFSFVPRSPGGPAWEIEVKQDLSGTYRVKDGIFVPISVSAATMKRLSAGDSKVNSGQCETKQKNIAQSGTKTIFYSLGISLSRCTFNYSDDEDLNATAATFQEIAETMQAGERLKQKHRFDHLGLDAELDSLLAKAKDGSAIELQNIAPILKSIVEDDEIMSPSRRKAKSLLELGGVHVEPGA